MSGENDKKKLQDRYEIKEHLGSGGSGTVLKAWDKQLRRFVAIKRLKNIEANLPLDDTQAEALWREAMTLAAIQHPNILTIYDFGIDDEGPYVITEYVKGESLDKVGLRGGMSRELFGEVVTQTLEALIAAHHAGLIHRDLKPQNILRAQLPSGAYQYKILDFGLAKFITRPTVQTLENNQSIYGSIFYIAPEQLRHQPLDVRTDLYAIGCVYYFLLAGKNAFEGETVAALIASHLEHRVTPLRTLRPDLPAELCDWIMKMINAAPADRPASADEALKAFRAIVPGKGSDTLVIKPNLGAKTIRIAPVLTDTSAVKTRMVAAPPAQTDSGLMTINSQLPPSTATQATMIINTQPENTRLAKLMLLVGMVAVLVGIAAIGVFLHTNRKASPPAESAAPVQAEAHPRPPQARPAQLAKPVERTAAEEVVLPEGTTPERRAQLDTCYEKIKDNSLFNWGNIGSVMEALGYAQLQEKYPAPDYEIISSIFYHDDMGRSLGELDLVVWDKKADKALEVYEVKVSNNLPSALRTAVNQLNKFKISVRDDLIARFTWEGDRTRHFRSPQFADVAIYGFIGNKGAKEAGYTIEFELSRLEVEYLQKRVLAYRKQGLFELK